MELQKGLPIVWAGNYEGRRGAARLAVADEMERMKLTRTLCARSLAEWRDATRAAGHVTKVMIGFTTAAAPRRPSELSHAIVAM